MAVRDPREIALERGRPSNTAASAAQNAGSSQQNQSNDSASKGGDGNGGYFEYPVGFMKEKTDYLSIKIFRQERSNEIFGLGDSSTLTEIPKLTQFSDYFNSTEQQKKIEKDVTFVFLPIPQQISDAIQVEYAEDTLNPLQVAGLNLGKEFVDKPVAAAAKVIDMLGGALGGGLNVDSKSISLMKTVLAGQAINNLGANVSPTSLITRASGQVLQSNLELLFSGVTLRSFPFTYDFAPRDVAEGQMVKNIIRTFKQSMVPSGGKPGDRNAIFINSPKVFQLEYKSGNKEHPFLNKFKICALTAIDVNYTASGTYATYGDGTPVHMRMTLQFKEINPIYSEDYDNEPIGVGF